MEWQYNRVNCYFNRNCHMNNVRVNAMVKITHARTKFIQVFGNFFQFSMCVSTCSGNDRMNFQVFFPPEFLIRSSLRIKLCQFDGFEVNVM